MISAPLGFNQLRPASTMQVNSGRLTTAIAPKFGSSCLYCNGSTGGPAIGVNVVSPGLKDYTAECWIYVSTSQLASIIEQPYYGITLNIDNSYAIGSGQSNGAYQTVKSPTAISTNVWTAIAVSRQGSTLRLYVNGSLVSSATFGTDLTQTTGTGTYIGSSIGNSPYTGYIDEVRISTIARYTGASYTVATAPFQDDQYTQLLCHFDNIAISNTSITDDNT